MALCLSVQPLLARYIIAGYIKHIRQSPVTLPYIPKKSLSETPLMPVSIPMSGIG